MFFPNSCKAYVINMLCDYRFNSESESNVTYVLDVTVRQTVLQLIYIYVQTSAFYKQSCDCCQNSEHDGFQLTSLTTAGSCASVSFLVCNYQLYWSLT